MPELELAVAEHWLQKCIYFSLHQGARHTVTHVPFAQKWQVGLALAGWPEKVRPEGWPQALQTVS